MPEWQTSPEVRQRTPLAGNVADMVAVAGAASLLTTQDQTESLFSRWKPRDPVQAAGNSVSSTFQNSAIGSSMPM